ncbi:MAG: PEP-CTERM sorting domain-containing protein [Deltaproteobacteria bacterium]|nr:PEP-CTERM sorting domain-containing protein [Deltaproteobacteria bacterium]
MTLVPGDYGQVLYASGFLPTDPQPFGTDFKGVGILNGVTPSQPTTYANGLIAGRQDLTYAARTPGPTSPDFGNGTSGTNFLVSKGAVRTVGGGNTRTPMGTFMAGIPHPTQPPPATLPLDCVTMFPAPCPEIISPVAFSGAFFEWTTGMVTHTDQGGDFETIRRATGFDFAVTTGTAIGGETRRIQLVTPWAASIRTVGPFGLGALLPTLAFGGTGILNLNVIPVPEPGTLAMLGFGVAGLVGLGAARRRNR